jgi:HNH endonuclease
MRDRDIVRFWSKVQRGTDAECWPWMASRMPFGHGQFYFDGRVRLAHRVTFLIRHGHWPEPCARHTCDNPPCCNPAHIIAGTKADNTADMMLRGRHSSGERPVGESHAMVKLNERQVLEIVEARGIMTQVALAAKYGVSQALISDIQLGKIWRHITR